MVNELLSEGARALKFVAERPAAEARMLFCRAAGCRAEDVICGRVKITADLKEKYEKIIRRRANGEPAAYITGEKEFYGIKFKVTPDVLIPRPDTETLVEFILESSAKSVIDICTGSGCIAVAAKLNRPELEVFAADVSGKALEVAKFNAENSNAEVTFFQTDILTQLPCGKFDMAVSNPPYIKTNEIETLDTGVKEYEPHLALDGGGDGLVFYRRISRSAPVFLNSGGILAFEAGFGQFEDISDIMKSAGFKNIGFKYDLAGIKRVIYGNI